MKKHYYYLGLNAGKHNVWQHLWTIGHQSDLEALEGALSSKYGGRAVLTKNGRSALTMALKAYFRRGDKIIVNGFTCYAVYEAVKAAGLTPVFADISEEDLNFNIQTLSRVIDEDCTGIIIQNTLGNPVEIEKIERFAGKYGLIIIEDLAHSAGVKYADGREAGTVGAATALSFGKDKSIDTISGGAVIFRHPCKNKVQSPTVPPMKSEVMRARLYPLLAAITRGLTHLRLNGVLMRILLKTHLVERSADSSLDLTRKIAPFQAKLALKQLQSFSKDGEGVLREFCLVNDRSTALEELKQAGYYFDGFWYEKPISPERYYEKVHFPEKNCPVAIMVAEKIMNFPTYYTKQELAPARRIVKKYLAGEKDG